MRLVRANDWTSSDELEERVEKQGVDRHYARVEIKLGALGLLGTCHVDGSLLGVDCLRWRSVRSMPVVLFG